MSRDPRAPLGGVWSAKGNGRVSGRSPGPLEMQRGAKGQAGACCPAACRDPRTAQMAPVCLQGSPHPRQPSPHSSRIAASLPAVAGSAKKVCKWH